MQLELPCPASLSFGTLEILAVNFGILEALLDCDFEWEFEAFLPLKLSGAGRDGDWGVDERDTCLYDYDPLRHQGYRTH